MVLEDEPYLLLVIALEKLRLGYRRPEGARRVNLAVGSLACPVDVRGFDTEAEIGIIGRIGGAGFISGLKFGEAVFYLCDILIIKKPDPFKSRVLISEFLEIRYISVWTTCVEQKFTYIKSSFCDELPL
jgi:hypothetical protein